VRSLSLKIENVRRDLKSFSAEQEANAAVAILLKPTDRDVEILFVKRVENLQDPWSGQIALPGGKKEPEDRDLKETVLRETLEETGINLLDRCSLLGVTDAIRCRINPEMKILPFVFLVKHEPVIRLNMDELKEYYWIPVEELFRNECTVRFGSEKHRAFIIGDIKIWGLTFRILKNIFSRLNKHGSTSS